MRIGTCSFADDALVKHWYPKGLPAKDRLGWYAERYSTVEVDSTFYRVPDEPMVQGWADRTPPGFVVHIKAFGLMTRHPVRLEQVPPDLREGLPVDHRGQSTDGARLPIMRRCRRRSGSGRARSPTRPS